jgi:hypothetical protein
MSDSNPELDKVLAALDLHTKVYGYFQTLGANERQAEAGARCGKDLFAWDGVRLKLKETDSIAVDDPKVAAIIGERYDFLLPPKKTLSEVASTVDPVIIERAAGGNLTARGAILTAIAQGAKPTPEHIAEMNRVIDGAKAKRGASVQEKDIADLVSNAHANRTNNSNTPRDNPWIAANWNVTKQAGIVRAMGLEKANQIAAAAGSYVGATHATRAG